MGLIVERKSLKNAKIKEGMIEIYNGKDAPATTAKAIEGLITNIGFIKEEIKGEEIEMLALTIINGTEGCRLKVKFDSGYGRSIAMKLPNVDLTQNVVIEGKYNSDTKQGSVFLSQHGSPVKQKWNRDNPGDLPQLIKTSFKGKDVYDNTDQLTYLRNYLKTLKAGNPAIDGAASMLEEDLTPVNTGVSINPEDDLPF
jgi:hypothetical protein